MEKTYLISAVKPVFPGSTCSDILLAATSEARKGSEPRGLVLVGWGNQRGPISAPARRSPWIAGCRP